jgi:hypothetical protein
MFPKHLEWQFHDDLSWPIYGVLKPPSQPVRIRSWQIGGPWVGFGQLWLVHIPDILSLLRLAMFLWMAHICRICEIAMWSGKSSEKPWQKIYRFHAWKHSGQDWASSCRKKSVQVAGREVFAEKLMGQALGYLRVRWAIPMTSQSVARWPFNINMTSFWGNHLSLKFVEIY